MIINGYIAIVVVMLALRGATVTCYGDMSLTGHLTATTNDTSPQYVCVGSVIESGVLSSQ